MKYVIGIPILSIFVLMMLGVAQLITFERVGYVLIGAYVAVLVILVLTWFVAISGEIGQSVLDRKNKK